MLCGAAATHWKRFVPINWCLCTNSVTLSESWVGNGAVCLLWESHLSSFSVSVSIEFIECSLSSSSLCCAWHWIAELLFLAQRAPLHPTSALPVPAKVTSSPAVTLPPQATTCVVRRTFASAPPSRTLAFQALVSPVAWIRFAARLALSWTRPPLPLLLLSPLMLVLVVRICEDLVDCEIIAVPIGLRLRSGLVSKQRGKDWSLDLHDVGESLPGNWRSRPRRLCTFLHACHEQIPRRIPG